MDYIKEIHGHCPSCDGENYGHPHWLPSDPLMAIEERFDDVLAECLDCGFYIVTRFAFAELDEINEKRDNLGLPRLSERKKLAKTGKELWLDFLDQVGAAGEKRPSPYRRYGLGVEK